MIVYANFIQSLVASRLGLPTCALCASLLTFAFFSPQLAHAESPSNDATVCIQPLGHYEKKALRPILTGITYVFGLKTKLLPSQKLPKTAWYAPRKRWRADKLLDYLDENFATLSKGCTFTIGFTKRDISTTKGEHKDWGILGLGQLHGRVGVVSTFRMHKRLKKPNSMIRRAVKVINHELGHILGLPHVKGEGCLMNDAEGTVSTVDAESGLLCDPTIEYIEKTHGWNIPRHTSFDWSKVE